MNGGYYGGPRGGTDDYLKIAPPSGLRDLPRFIRELLGGFFSRLGYTFALVWKTDPLILFTMLFISIFDGVMGPVGTVLSSRVINEMQLVLVDRTKASESGIPYTATFIGSAVLGMLIVLFVYRIINRVTNRISNTIMRIAGEKVVRTVKVQIMEKAKTVDLASFDRPEFYEKLENANREAGNRPISTLQSTFSIMSTLISFFSYLAILATVPDMWWMPLGIVIITVPSAIVSFVYRRKHFRYIRYRSHDRRQMSYCSETLVNKDLVKEIRIFDLSDTFIGKYKEVFERYFKGLRRLIMQENFWMVIIAVISALVNCFFYAMIAHGVFVGRFMIGDYSRYTNSLTQIATCVTTLINTSASIYEGTLFIDNLIAFLKEKQTVVPASAEPARIAHGEPHTIVFDHVSFAYPGKDYNVINDFSTTIAPGETVVLVGLNGAGKTTLIKLLTRLYDPTEGRILLDGRDLREYDVKDLYSMFGIIFQDFGKYAFSVRENIAFGDISREQDDERIRQSAVHGSADAFIDGLPLGYDTPLTRIFEQTGVELSGGQWQKLAIARAFYRDSDIMILDEPTASLDPMAEQEVFNQFDSLRRGKTTIFVSHRLSSAVIASKILVMQNGRLIEEGNHRELMEAGGEYFKLFSTQAKRYLEGGIDFVDRVEERKPRRHREGGTGGSYEGYQDEYGFEGNS